MQNQEEIKILDAVCNKCQTKIKIELSQGEFDIDYMLEARLNYAICQKCENAQNYKIEQLKQREIEKVKQHKKDALYLERIENSRIKEFELDDYDPNHKNANLKLDKFLTENQNKSVWIGGITGKNKTRLLQKFAFEKLKTKTVYFAPADILMNDIVGYFSKSAYQGNRFLNELFEVDLLIIDDLGTEDTTVAKMKRFYSLINARYVRSEQQRKYLAGRWIGEPPKGWQLWITSNDNGKLLQKKYQNLGLDLQEKPLIRRLQEICHRHMDFEK